MSPAQLINAIAMFFYLAIFARVILSWFPMGQQHNHPLVQFIHAITEPLLAPIRRMVPRTGMFDFTPMIALVVVIVIQRILLALLP